MKADRTKADPTKADPTKADPTKADPTKANPTKANPTKAGGSAATELREDLPGAPHRDRGKANSAADGRRRAGVPHDAGAQARTGDEQQQETDPHKGPPHTVAIPHEVDRAVALAANAGVEEVHGVS
jgi:hypothetical protein